MSEPVGRNWRSQRTSQVKACALLFCRLSGQTNTIKVAFPEDYSVLCRVSQSGELMKVKALGKSNPLARFEVFVASQRGHDSGSEAAGFGF